MIFSAHGVPKAVPAEAQRRQMVYVDATCPLVSKVHIEAERHHAAGLQMIMIGHEGHPEVIGTMGQLPAGEVVLVETVEDVATAQVRDPQRLAFITQTTLSVDDTAAIVAALQARFPAIIGPAKEDICYATTNRQAAVKEVAPKVRCASGHRRAELQSTPSGWSRSAAPPAAPIRSWSCAPPTSTGARWRASAASA